jgi:pimeloyl-ACP methyl ester carboxylesterase
MAVLFAATYPERAPALVLYGAFLSPELNERTSSSAHLRAQSLDELEQRWGSPDYCDDLLREDAPSMADDESFRRWYATRIRLGASPAAAVELVRMALDTDARPLLPTINVPTLILHRVGDRTCSVRNARFAAQQIPEAKCVELPVSIISAPPRAGPPPPDALPGHGGGYGGRRLLRLLRPACTGDPLCVRDRRGDAGPRVART